MDWKKRPPPNIVRIKGAYFSVPIDLDIGDSFFVPSLDTSLTIMHIDTHYRKRRLYKLSALQRIEKGMLGVRFWRIA